STDAVPSLSRTSSPNTRGRTATRTPPPARSTPPCGTSAPGVGSCSAETTPGSPRWSAGCCGPRTSTSRSPTSPGTPPRARWHTGCPPAPRPPGWGSTARPRRSRSSGTRPARSSWARPPPPGPATAPWWARPTPTTRACSPVRSSGSPSSPPATCRGSGPPPDDDEDCSGAPTGSRRAPSSSAPGPGSSPGTASPADGPSRGPLSTVISTHGGSCRPERRHPVQGAVRRIRPLLLDLRLDRRCRHGGRQCRQGLDLAQTRHLHHVHEDRPHLRQHHRLGESRVVHQLALGPRGDRAQFAVHLGDAGRAGVPGDPARQELECPAQVADQRGERGRHIHLVVHRDDRTPRQDADVADAVVPGVEDPGEGDLLGLPPPVER